LPNGGILGVAGHSREGFSTYASLTDVLAEQLRPAIVQAAEMCGFRELSELIPELLADCNRAHPELFFCVSLLGTDNGTVRGGAWDSDGKADVPTETDGAWQILSPSAEFSGEVDAALRVCLEHIGLRNPAITSEVLQNIIRVMAPGHPDINDHTLAEIICASPRECMNASNITTGTMSATKVLFGDGSALTTASRVLTAEATQTATATAAASAVAIPGLTFSLVAATTSDTYNLFGSMLGAQTAGTVGAVCQIALYVDGVSKQTVVVAYPSLNGETSTSFTMSITGLSAGAHTLQMYFYSTGSSYTFQFYPGSTVLCQRIF
jgi:hypothetical protein